MPLHPKLRNPRHIQKTPLHHVRKHRNPTITSYGWKRKHIILPPRNLRHNRRRLTTPTYLIRRQRQNVVKPITHNRLRPPSKISNNRHKPGIVHKLLLKITNILIQMHRPKRARIPQKTLSTLVRLKNYLLPKHLPKPPLIKRRQHLSHRNHSRRA